MSKRTGRPLPLTPTAYHILLSLTDGAMHGYAMKAVVEERTGGVVRLGAGTLYHSIKSLRDRGFVVETKPPESHESPNPRLRFYAITPEGVAVLEAEMKRLEADVELTKAKLASLRGLDS